MRNLFYFVILFTIAASVNFAQEQNDWGISFNGYVKADVMFDTRQTVDVREGHFLLYPEPEALDVNGDDINAVPQFNMLSVQTRLRGNITAPDVLGAKVTGAIEGAFFGHSNGDINGFRLRHAFLKLGWETTSFLAGQYWHPMFVIDCFPGVVSFNTGVPFQPFARNTQLRLTQKFGAAEVFAAVYSERDFADIGPFGTSSSYLRNSAIPQLHFQARMKTESLLLGAGVNFKSILPQTSVTVNNPTATNDGFVYKTEEKVNSLAFTGYGKISTKAFSLKLQGVYGQNMYDVLMLGGYAVKTVDPFTFEQTYTNLNTLSVWSDFATGKELGFGLFAGYSKNLGADDNVAGTIFTRGSSIESLLRVSPRIMYNLEKVRFAAELEYTSAAYGTVNQKAEVENAESVQNIRMLLGFYLFF